MPTVNVIVSGPVGCGKSALMTEILAALKAIGVDAKIIGQDDYDLGGDPGAMLDMYRNGLNVVIQEAFERKAEVDLVQRTTALELALDRAHTILSNMASEHTTGWRGIFARWPIHHEPLRNDARHALPQIEAALGLHDRTAKCRPAPHARQDQGGSDGD